MNKLGKLGARCSAAFDAGNVSATTVRWPASARATRCRRRPIQARDRRGARLHLQGAPAVRGEVGRADDRREAELHPAAGPTADPGADGDHQRRRDAARHAPDVRRPDLRGLRPLRLALSPTSSNSTCDAPGRRRRRLWRRRGAGAGARDGHAPVRRDDRLHGRSRARSRAWTARRTSPSMPSGTAGTSQGILTIDIIGSSLASNGVRDPHTIRLFAEGVPTAENADADHAAAIDRRRERLRRRASSPATSRRPATTPPTDMYVRSI